MFYLNKVEIAMLYGLLQLLQIVQHCYCKMPCIHQTLFKENVDNCHEIFMIFKTFVFNLMCAVILYHYVENTLIKYIYLVYYCIFCVVLQACYTPKEFKMWNDYLENVIFLFNMVLCYFVCYSWYRPE